MKCHKTIKCKCGKETRFGRCKSCSNKERTGKFHWKKESIENRKNEKNPFWKGKEVGKDALHSWVKRRKLKPKFCDVCLKNKPFELANISGLYKRNVDDFRWLCRRCHSKEHRGKEWHNYVYFKRMEKRNGKMPKM